MANHSNITLDPCLIPRFTSGMLETMGTDEDADYIYEPSDFGLDAHPDLSRFSSPRPSRKSNNNTTTRRTRRTRLNSSSRRCKLENETMAGDKVRGASMIAHQKRKRSGSPAADDDTDNEASTPRKASGVSTTSSLELSDAEGSKKKLKRRKTDRRGESSTSTDIVKILERDIAQRAEHQQAQAATIKEYVADAREGRSQIIGLLEKLIASENNN
ncbi:hypothetical protein B0H13DRAFT_2579732 [Mycena leptocephala]|nr:hypothetical protein B0H13DRAFT_2579732 [Mycena leptocephala]